MTRDDVIRMAREAGAEFRAETILVNGKDADDFVQAFAALVAQQEREACAKVCDEQAALPECHERAKYCSDAIRARGAKDALQTLVDNGTLATTYHAVRILSLHLMSATYTNSASRVIHTFPATRSTTVRG